MYRDGVLPPSAWIDITALDELRGIAVAEGCLRLGALACHEELAPVSAGASPCPPPWGRRAP